MMKLITWNVNGRVNDAPRQVEALGSYKPDVVALQDVRFNAIAAYRRAFSNIGLHNVLHYLHSLREVRLSDHVPLEVVFDFSQSES